MLVESGDSGETFSYIKTLLRAELSQFLGNCYFGYFAAVDIFSNQRKNLTNATPSRIIASRVPAS